MYTYRSILAPILPPILTTDFQAQYRGALCGVFFLLLINPADISGAWLHMGWPGSLVGWQFPWQASTVVLFFLTAKSVPAVEAMVQHPTPPYPPEPELVRAEPTVSRTVSGVIRPGSSGRGRKLHSRRYFESPPSVLKM